MLDGIQRGDPVPRVPGRIGLFFREYARYHREVVHLLARNGVDALADGYVRGSDLGPLELTPMGERRTDIPLNLWGPVTHLPMLCEELARVVDLTLWLNARAANTADRLLKVDGAPAIRLEGDYRWYTPHRVTPGESLPTPSDRPVAWQHARCIKATADDLTSPPHPLDYTLDYYMGPPGLKTIRSFVGRWTREADRFEVFPGRNSETTTITLQAPDSRSEPERNLLQMFIAYREPWDTVWTACGSLTIDEADVLAHSLTWLDFTLELEGHGPIADSDTIAARVALRASGLSAPMDLALSRANLCRSVIPAALAVALWLRQRKLR